MLTNPDRRRSPLRLLSPRTTRQKFSYLQSRSPPRPSSRPNRRWIYRRKCELALGILVRLHRRRRNPTRRPLLPPRNILPENPRRPRKASSQRNRRTISHRSRAYKDPIRPETANFSRSTVPPFTHPAHRPSPGYLHGLHLRSDVPYARHFPRPLDKRRLLQRIVRYRWTQLHLHRNRFLPRLTVQRGDDRSNLPCPDSKKRRSRTTGIQNPSYDHRCCSPPSWTLHLRLDSPGTLPLDRAKYWCSHFRNWNDHGVPVYSDVYG